MPTQLGRMARAESKTSSQRRSSPSRGGVGEAGVVTDEEWRYGHENPPLAGEVARRAGGVVNQTCQCTTLQLAGEVSAKPAEG